MTAKVCIGISIYKQPSLWIKESINSVLNQTEKDWQLLIRTDGPEAIQDKQAALLANYHEHSSKIKLIIGAERLGTFGSYKEIFNQCDSKFLVQLDADDTLAADAIEKGIEMLAIKKESPFVYSQAMLMCSDGISRELDKRALRGWQEHIDIVQFIYFHMRLVRTSSYHKIGGYDEKYQLAGDYDLSLRLAELAQPVHIAEPLYNYRIHNDSTSQKKRISTHLEAVEAARAALHRRGLAKSFRLNQTPDNQTITLEPLMVKPLLVAGMHRSGTSLLAGCLSQLEVFLGDQLLEADSDNPDGYNEDIAILEQQCEWFQNTLSDSENGWPDWGWTPGRSVSCLGQAMWHTQAQLLIRNLVNRFKSIGENKYLAWGWKDPRSTLIIPFWNKHLAELIVVGIYRAPWDACDALMRVKYPLFRSNPVFILPIWNLYNNRLIDFQEAEPSKCIVVNAHSFALNPCKLIELLNSRWDWRLQEDEYKKRIEPLIRKNRLKTIQLPDAIEDLYELVYPEYMKLYQRLEARADLGAGYKSKNNLDDLAKQKLYKIPAQPILSIIITTFNPCHWILEAIASIHRHAEDINRVEIIIVNDGTSEPESIKILQKLKMGGYQIINQQNSGLSAARNCGIALARAEIILPLDDDNRLLGPYLNKGLNHMIENHNIDILYGDKMIFGAIDKLIRPGPMNYDELIKVNQIDACALYRKQLWRDCGGYDEKLKALEDWDFWLSALIGGLTASYLPETCFEYRIREDSMLQKHLRDREEHYETINYLRNKHNLPISYLI